VAEGPGTGPTPPAAKASAQPRGAEEAGTETPGATAWGRPTSEGAKAVGRASGPTGLRSGWRKGVSPDKGPKQSAAGSGPAVAPEAEAAAPPARGARAANGAGRRSEPARPKKDAAAAGGEACARPPDEATAKTSR